jgi:hypothetical protein|tara:strand:+ start:1298 stop:1399 length:102 start_codon:yes stop_codon:yes gene_type:complete
MKMTSWHQHHKHDPIRINAFAAATIEDTIRERT